MERNARHLSRQIPYKNLRKKHLNALLLLRYSAIGLNLICRASLHAVSVMSFSTAFVIYDWIRTVLILNTMWLMILNYIVSSAISVRIILYENEIPCDKLSFYFTLLLWNNIPRINSFHKSNKSVFLLSGCGCTYVHWWHVVRCATIGSFSCLCPSLRLFINFLNVLPDP